MRKRIGNVLWGLIFVAIGIGVIGEMGGAWEFQLFFDGWWTLFLILPAAIHIVENGIRISNTLCLLGGTAMLAACQNLITWDMLAALFLPVVLIVIGAIMIFKNLFHIGMRKVSIKTEDKRTESVVFSGKKLLVENEFKGMDCEAVFGGITLDLRRALITQNVSIDALAVFGGIDILLPANVKVCLSDTSLFGGCSNRFASNKDSEAPTVYLNATALFGGVEVK